MNFIELHNICKTYTMGDIQVPVLKGVSASIAAGECVALVGASGSGKTTLMNILGCLDRPTEGEYWLDGEEVSQFSPDRRALVRNHKLGFVFQNFNLLARTSALENVAMPLSYTSENLSDRQARRRAREMLCRVGLADRLEHEPSAFGRTAAARGDRPGADQPSAGPVRRRADRQPGLSHQRRDPPDVPPAQPRGRHHGDPGHARRRRGPLGRPPHPHPRRVDRGGRGGDARSGRPERGRPAMKAYRTVKTALRALRRNPMRAMLTTLGIVIGIGSVIAMMEIGSGSSQSL